MSDLPRGTIREPDDAPEAPKFGHLRDSGPLPEEALRTLAYINAKDRRIEELENKLRELVESWEYDGDLTRDEIKSARACADSVTPPKRPNEETA